MSAAVAFVIFAMTLAALVALRIALAAVILVVIAAARAGAARTGRARARALVLRAAVGALLRRVLILRARLLRVARLIAIARLLRALVALANLRIGLDTRRDRRVACLWIHAHALRVRNAAE